MKRGLKEDFGNLNCLHFDFAQNFENFGFEWARLLCPLENNEQRGFARKKAARFGRRFEGCFDLKEDLTKPQGLTKDF